MSDCHTQSSSRHASCIASQHPPVTPVSMFECIYPSVHVSLFKLYKQTLHCLQIDCFHFSSNECTFHLPRMPFLKSICLCVLQHLILNKRKINKEGGGYNKGNNKYTVIENLKYQRGLKLSLHSALPSSFLPPSPFCFVLSVCL